MYVECARRFRFFYLVVVGFMKCLYCGNEGSRGFHHCAGVTEGRDCPLICRGGEGGMACCPRCFTRISPISNAWTGIEAVPVSAPSARCSCGGSMDIRLNPLEDSDARIAYILNDLWNHYPETQRIRLGQDVAHELIGILANLGVLNTCWLSRIQLEKKLRERLQNLVDLSDKHQYLPDAYDRRHRSLLNQYEKAVSTVQNIRGRRVFDPIGSQASCPVDVDSSSDSDVTTQPYVDSENSDSPL